MAIGYKNSANVELDSVFVWRAAGDQSDDSIKYLLASGADISKYLFNASTNSVTTGYLDSQGRDLGTLYCTSGCNAICTGTCTSTCTSSCTGSCTGCTGSCASDCTGSCSTACGGNCGSGCVGI